MRRLLGDIVSQAAPLLVSVLDRLVLAGLMVRLLGIQDFEYWALCLSGASLFAILDSGCLMTFSNEISKAIAQSNENRAIRIFRESNSIFLGLSALAMAIAGGFASIPAGRSAIGLDVPDAAATLIATFLLLTGSVVAKLALSNMMAIYRATGEFGRGTLITSLTDTARILLVCVALWAGAPLVALAAIYSVATLIFGLAIFAFDIGRRHPRFALRWSSPTRAGIEGSLRTALAFGLPYVAVAAMAQGPVILLGRTVIDNPGVLAQFVLFRTISNLWRTVLLKLTNILGMEIARHHFADRHAYVERVLNLIELPFAVATGIGVGLLLSFGSVLMLLWVGHSVAYDPAILGILMLPLVLTPTYLVHSALIQFGNAPRLWTIGSFAQVAVAILIYVLGHAWPPIVRMSLAVAGSEILCLAIPISLYSLQGLRWRSVRMRLAGSATTVALIALVHEANRQWVPELAGGPLIALTFNLLLFGVIAGVASFVLRHRIIAAMRELSA